MAPPTIAPPMIPPAKAAPRPRCALAGVAFSQRRVKVTHAVFETGRLAKERTTVNPKLTLLGSWPEKTVFSGQCQRRPRKHAVSANAGPVCNEDERLSRKPARGVPAINSRPRNAVAARRSRRSSRRRHRPDRRNNRNRGRSRARNNRGWRARRRRWRRRSARRLRQRQDPVAHGRVPQRPKQPAWRRQRVPSKFSSWLRLSHRARTAVKRSVAAKLPHFA